ncbi:DUF805 domain-containing protein [Flavobacterium ponti]|jgi:uncharacterized membrane protein YhaH (DUF805 family)|uniref:DUF805 domain-containing protein n=1 Tax=Flavobacterium ponti TaxID=665133 RepID=A0ABV9P3T2_9FLAO
MQKAEQDYNILDWFKKVVLNNYANFEGRARRKEYWSYLLVYFLIFLPIYVLTIGSIVSESAVFGSLGGILMVIFALGMFIPNLAVSVRRLHDVNKSGWTLLLGLIPFVSLYLLYLYFSEGTNGPNDYGNDPKRSTHEINEIGASQE